MDKVVRKLIRPEYFACTVTIFLVSMIAYIFIYFCFLQISLLLPGFVLLKKTRLLAESPGLELAFSYVITLVFFALLATLGYVLRVDSRILFVVGWSALGLSLFYFLKNSLYKELSTIRFPLICLLMMSIFSCVFIGLTFKSSYSYVPDPTPQANRNYHVLNVKVLNIAQTQANDNYIPYRQAQFFTNRSDPARDSFIGEWGVHFFQRTPLMGAVTANYFTLLHEKPPIDYSWSTSAADIHHTYLQFQILAQILNALFIIPAFFLIVKLFNKRVALLTCLFLVPSQFFLFNAVFSWPKSLVAFFILLSWLLLLQKNMKYTILAGVVSGVAYLTHDLAVLYIGASVLLLLFGKRFKETLVFSLSTGVFMLPWLVVSSIIYNKPSSFILYPLSTKDIPQPEQQKQIIHQFFHTSILRILFIRLENIFYLFSPYQLFTSEGGQAGFRRLWSFGLYSLPGAVGLGLIIPFVLGVFKKLRDMTLWLLIFIPVVLEALVIGWPKGLGALHFAEAIVVIMSALGVYYLTRLRNKFWLLGAYALNTVQLVFFTIYSFKFVTGVWLTQLGDLLRLAVMAMIIALCGWLIFCIAQNKRTWITD